MVQRSTGDVSSSVFLNYREALADAIEKGDIRFQWLSGYTISKSDYRVLLDTKSFIFTDLVKALRNGPYPGKEIEWCGRVLATIIERGILEWRVVIPGKRGIYHEKGMVFHDSCDHVVFLGGSWNETLSGYQRNAERIDVHLEEWDPIRCEEARRWFDSVWHGEERWLRVFPIQEAIRRGEIEQREDDALVVKESKDREPGSWTPELMFLSIQDKAPWSLKDPYIGTLVEPLPHQVHVHQRTFSRPPLRFLLADEVGLGKTIEAGLILSTMVATGLARRVLILAPANVLEQWEQELRKKFRLEPWVLRGKSWMRGSEEWGTDDLPFNRLPGDSPHICLVSLGIAFRANRRGEFEKSSWDLIIVDEAHRARGGKEGDQYRKNNLLKTLELLSLNTASILLLTATPMQLGVHELYDLLYLLGLPPHWRQREAFQFFVTQLDEDNPGWHSLFEMARESYDYYKELHSLNTSEFEKDLTSGIEFFDIPSSIDPRRDYDELLNVIRNDALYRLPELTESQRHLLKIALYRMSPLYQLVCRNTRNLLRRYSAKGMARIRVPERLLEDPISIDFTPEERELYDAVEMKYVKPFYRDYGKAGLPVHGVGFILTIYRKRAASSWASVNKSFQRRKAKLEKALTNWGPNSIHMLFGSVALKDIIEEEEEIEEIESEGSINKELSKPDLRIDIDKVKEVVERERAVIEQLLDELEALRQRGLDSKRDALIAHLKSTLAERRGVLVFSQYKDTVDDIAESLFYEFGSSMAKYHGSGGEVWDGGRFKQVKKEDVKKRIENGEFRLLIATDAASEGLNLQMMDAVVNYDLPWNPMRIEQRIGRIDRVTQTSPTISIGVLVPRNTIEMDVYTRCVERLGMFKQALGPLQPILVESFIEDLVLGKEDLESGWEEIEDRWATAKEHAHLFEEALSAQEFKGGWQERKDAERAALQHLLSEVGYIEFDGVWERGRHRISVEGIRDGCDWMTALSHDRLFVALLSEMGQMPGDLERDGLHYRVIESGGSMALAVRHTDGSVRLIRDLTDMEGENEEQVGTDWEAAIREVKAGEIDRMESFRRFRKEQGRVREKEWRRSVERDVIVLLLRWSGYDLESCVERIIGDSILTRLFVMYNYEDLSERSLLTALRSVDTPKKNRGKSPSLERIIRNAGELIVQGGSFHRDFRYQ